ncbi:MAG: hypothetical protein ACON42_00155, partial [Flavobacteriaceae bacterium]
MRRFLFLQVAFLLAFGAESLAFELSPTTKNLKYLELEATNLADNSSVSLSTTSTPSIVGTWRWAQTAAAFGYGPNQNDISWYSNPAGDLTTRACEFDDEFVINADGTFQ